MTIKPVINQKTNEKNKDNLSTHGQEQQIQNVRTNVHRNVIGNKGNNVEHGQSPQRRGDIAYEDLTSRHRRSPHKSGTRSKRNTTTSEPHHNHHKRNNDREKHASSPHSTSSSLVTKSPKHCAGSIGSGGSVSGGASVNTSVGNSSVGCISSGGGVNGASGVGGICNVNNSITSDVLNVNNVGNNMRSNILPTIASTTNQQQQQQQQQINNKNTLIEQEIEEILTGYNSGDEHLVSKENLVTLDEWEKRDKQFMKTMKERGYIVKDVAEDGACLFRAISLQIYGDEDMHEVIREQTMDYIYENREYFAHFVTEDINNYVQRKRNKDAHGNHIEIQAISEIYNRRVELYCYQTNPTNIFYSKQTNNNSYDPLRLSYQRGSHYNAILDPYSASVGVGLGLAGYKPESQTREAIRLSEQQEIEQTMFEDKLKTTDWEATNEEIEEQIARESYLQWCRDNMQKCHNKCSSNGVEESGSDNICGIDGENPTVNHENYTISSSTSGIRTSTSSSASASNYYNMYSIGSGYNASSSSTVTSAELKHSKHSATVSNISDTIDNSNIGHPNISNNNIGYQNKCNILGETSSGKNCGKIDNTDNIDKFLNDNNKISKKNIDINNKEYCDSDDADMSSSSSMDQYTEKMKHLKSSKKTSKGNLLFHNLTSLQQGNNNTNNNNNYNSNNNTSMRNSKRLKRKIKDLTNSGKLNLNLEIIENQQQEQQQKLQLKHQLHNTHNFIKTNNKFNEHIMKRPKSTDDGGGNQKKIFNEQQQLHQQSKQNKLITSTEEIMSTAANTTEQQSTNFDFIKNNFLSQTDNKQNYIKNISSENNDDGIGGVGVAIKSNIQNSSQLPGTSKETEPVSKFYQSLLESSYTDDGVRQFTEMEMINKAIQMSRSDYIEDQRVKYGLNNYTNYLPQHDNDDDSA